MYKHAKLLVLCFFCFANAGQTQEYHHEHNHDHNQRDLTDYVNYIASHTNEEYFSDHDHELWHHYLNRPHPNVNTITAYFEDAAEEFGVPAALLKVIGQVENNWTQIGPSIDQGWGIMHLVKNQNVNTLGEAAELIGVSEQVLKDDARQNIRGAAALLAKYADNNIVGNHDIALWFEACKTFSGLYQEKYQILQAQTYFDRLESGHVSRTVWDETIEISARSELAIPLQNRRQIGNIQNHNRQSASADYGPAISNITSCNFTTGRNTAIDTWVNHWIGVGTYAGAISWFQNCSAGASAHFVIRSSDGQITQVVAVANTAWHAGASGFNNNHRSIGVEHEATATNPELWNSAPMLNASATMACHFTGIYNIPPTRSLPGIREHNEMPGTNTSCAGSIPWTTWMDLFNTCVGGNPSALDCTTAVTIECGVTYSGPSSDAPSAVETYGCNNWTEAGPERIHKITSPGSGTLTATLSNYTGDLDVYILGSCDPNDCLGTVNSDSAVFDNAVAGQVYYIVVDADDGSGSAYDLIVDCPTGAPTGLDCSNAVSLTCGVTYSGPSSAAASAVEGYACNSWTESGPERVHTVEILANGSLTASLSNYTGDLDVYILSSCDPADCVGTVNPDSAVLDNAIAGQTYYIVVDADDGSGSAYDLLVDCPILPPDGLVCTNAVPLSCGTTYSGAESTEPSYVDAYACNNWTETGPERVHAVTVPADGTLTASLFSYTGDLDIYILNSCDPDDCVGTVGADFAVLDNAVAGQTYYLVVDADDGSGSAYDLVVDCMEPEMGFSCTDAVPLTCGVLHSEPASAETSNVSSYSCNAWVEPGPERVHSVVAPASGTIAATISNFTGDLDVFILSACDTLTCVAVGNFTATLTTAVPGETYYIIVDGYDGSDSAYDIIVDCTAPGSFTCDNAVPLTCGVLHSEPASTASSTVGLYSCNDWEEPGPERVHIVTVPADGTLEATISNFIGDLDVFILSACDTAACVAVGNVTATLTTAVAGQTYYIVVDSYDGTGGAYDILVTCPEVAGCVDHLDVNGTYSANAIFQAIHSITSDATFNGGAVIDMHAADSIRLDTNFTIELGTEFYIHIEDCQ